MQGIYYYGTKLPESNELTIGMHIFYDDIDTRMLQYGSALEKYIRATKNPMLIFEEGEKFENTVARFKECGSLDKALFVETHFDSPLLKETNWETIIDFVNPYSTIKFMGGNLRSLLWPPLRFIAWLYNRKDCLGYVEKKIRKAGFKTEFMDSLVFQDWKL